jgi:diacylglycerol kinase family enzyme
MTALELMTQSEGEDFRRRVKYFMTKAALSILDEATNAAFHYQREALARTILTSVESKLQVFIFAVISNATIAAAANLAAVPDGDIEFVITNAWNDLF